MRQESGDIRPLGKDNTNPGRKVRSGVVWKLSLVAVGSLSIAGYWWKSAHHAKPGVGQTREIPVVTRKERKVSPRLSNPILLELLRQEAEGKVDERRWQDIRGLSEADVKAAIMELGYPDPSPGMLGVLGDSKLRQMLFHRWGQLDPAAANALAKAMFPEHFARSREAVIAAWIIQGGAAEAWEAVREEGQMWDCTRSVPGEVAQMIVASLSDLDDAVAFASVMRLNDEDSMVAGTLCHVRAAEAVVSPQARDAFLVAAATHPQSYVLQCARENLIKEWAKVDAAEAEVGLEALSLPGDEEGQAQFWIDFVRRDKNSDAKRAAVLSEGEETGAESMAYTNHGQSSGRDAWQDARAQITSRWEKSPAIFVDFDLREETRRMMEQMPFPDLEVWLRTLRSRYDEHLGRNVPEELREMILVTAVSLAPGPLAGSLAERSTEDWEDSVHEVMDLWIKHDPGAALKWLEGDVPYSMKEDLEYYLEEARHELSGH